jgi:hypothetical protein
MLERHRHPGLTVPEATARLWGRAAWMARVGQRVVQDPWRHPLPVPWALALTAMRSALRAAEQGRTGGAQWAELAVAMLTDDRLRSAASAWVPDW